MINVLTNLRLLAGVLFWALADLILIGLWAALFFGAVYAIVEGSRHD